MNKPVKVYREPLYNYFDVIHYIEEKYKINLDDYAGQKIDNTKPYLNFWDWLLDNYFYDVSNGSSVTIYVKDYLDKLEGEQDEYVDWILEIFQLFYDEFSEDTMDFWIEW